MTTTQYILRLCTWRRGEFILNCLAWGPFHLLPLVNGLAIRGIFNALSGNAAADWNVWSMLAILSGIYASRQFTFLVGYSLFMRFHLSVAALLRRNLMDHLLCAPGSRRLPESPSEAVSRFRDDVGDVNTYLESWIDFSDFLLYGTGVVLIMA